jgi:hypothetical protein
VVGSSPPADAADAVVTVTPEQVNTIEEEVPADLEGQVEAARPFLTAARITLNVPDELGGFSTRRRVSTDDGVFVDETVWFRTPNRLRRVRRVLSSTIETVVGPEGGVETADGTETVELDQVEAERLLERARRHPLMLITAHANGNARFRLVSRRRQGDRDVGVLELVDPTRDRLRITIDAGSGLIRSVESTEWRPDLGTRVQVTEAYSDYRRVGRMRAPFFCVRTIDDGTDQVSCSTQLMVLEAPAVALLRRGGPERLR